MKCNKIRVDIYTYKADHWPYVFTPYGKYLYKERKHSTSLAGSIIITCSVPKAVYSLLIPSVQSVAAKPNVERTRHHLNSGLGCVRRCDGRRRHSPKSEPSPHKSIAQSACRRVRSLASKHQMNNGHVWRCVASFRVQTLVSGTVAPTLFWNEQRMRRA